MDEALDIFQQIPPERMNSVPSIGINIHTERMEKYQDIAVDIISGKVSDLEILDSVSYISNNSKAIIDQKNNRNKLMRERDTEKSMCPQIHTLITTYTV